MIDIGTHHAFGADVQIRVSPELADLLEDALIDLRRSDSASVPADSTHTLDVELVDGEWTVRWDGGPRYVGAETGMALYDSLIALNHLASHRAAEGGLAVLHGGAVAIGEAVVAIVGHSGAGKSTLTLGLALAGHDFLSDEVIAVRDDLIVEGFPRPIGLRAAGAATLGLEIPDGPFDFTYPYRVSAVGRRGRGLAMVCVVRRSETPIAARIAPMRQGRALFELTDQTLGSDTVELQMFRRLDALVRRVPVVELHYSDLNDAITMLERSFGSVSPIAGEST